jgi:TRAP-type C4-dicarboxylate transport system permease small subunit
MQAKKVLFMVLNNVEEVVLTALFVLMVVVCFLQVIARFILSISLSWSEALLCACLVWTVCLAASAAFKRKSHLGVDFLTSLLPPKAKKGVTLATYLVCIAFHVILIYVAVKLVGRQIHTKQIIVSLEIPIAYVTAAIPVGFGLSIIRIIQVIVDDYILPKDAEDRPHISEGLL